MTRPNPGHPAPPGYHWEAVPEPAGQWTLLPADDTRLCSRTIGPTQHHHRCPNTAVALLNRPRWVTAQHREVDVWWAYCQEHLHGRWVQDGQILDWRLAADQDGAA